MPALSVHMPARNAAATIRAAVRSTLAAMPRDAEFVILDDASTDDTADRARAAAGDDPRLRVLRSERQLGTAAASRRLLEETESEFVARMDADDVTLPGRFRAQRARLDRGADVVFTTYQVIDERGRPSRRPSAPIALSPRAGSLAMLIDCPYAHSTVMARRAAITGAGGYRDAVSEDLDLWLRVAASEARIARLALPRLLLRAHGSSVSAQAGFRRRMAEDAGIVADYRALAQRFLRVDDAPWLPHLAFLRDGPLTDAGRPLVADFVERMTGLLRVTPMGALERAALDRRARQELSTRA